MSMTERNKATPAVYLILEREEKIFLIRRANTGYQDGNYNLPAGHVDAGELPTFAAIREANEEVGVTIRLEDVIFAHALYQEKSNPSGDRVDYFFAAKRWTGEPYNAEPDKCDDTGWFAPDAFPENMTPHVRHAIECYRKGVPFSELPKEFFYDNPLYAATRP